ncbi:hypothetical protein BKA70DRAFT_1090524 [Coprinopsis sp. MPI-PUGE-AT-0042]|nr:hypothetical protein BKA70DRAFT_1090524 [Coprinopsis sp. MPI-PUGE-AT-0042]
MRATGTARPVSGLVSPTARRRPPSKASPSPGVNGDSKESLSATLKQETEQKEQLLLQVQDKDQAIEGLSTENGKLSSALSAAEVRLNELYTEQSRWETEMAQRIEVAEKLREQVRELEKEKRDLQRRYNEQTASFDAERQSFYDNEQHLKSRIQSLTTAKKRAEDSLASSQAESALTPVVAESEKPAPPPPQATSPDYGDPDNEPAEMTALKLELSTLSTSYASMQSTLLMLQSQLVDLKRVNQGLQEENESYNILLTEKTLNGQFDLLRQVGSSSNRTSDSGDDDEDDDLATSADSRSLHSTGRSVLDRVDEEPEGLTVDTSLAMELAEVDTPMSSRSSRPSRQGRKRTMSASNGRGESLADLPITGPGLDLAAELGRAENKDILDGHVVDDGRGELGKGRPSKTSRKVSGGGEEVVEALQKEVKSLKDANKALSLYASKIIDRIISQDGFEHVLAADYEKEPQTPMTAQPKSNSPPQASPAKPRPQSVLISRTVSSPAPASKAPSPPVMQPVPKANRRSLSFDWKSFSFSTEPKKPEMPANFRPLTLKPGANPVVTGGRKLDTQEDEEDRRERERLNATMKLMGIQPSPSIHAPPPFVEKPADAPPSTPSYQANRRFSFFGMGKTASNDSTDANSINSFRSIDSSQRGLGLSDLTHDALAEAEAQNSLAALDARERNLTEEIAKGSNGGFTEISRRRSIGRRSRRSAGGSGSGSTVFSAGDD